MCVTASLCIDDIMSDLRSPVFIAGSPSKDVLLKEFKDKQLTELRTPAFVVDRALFAQNCALMHEAAKEWGANFRAHLKTHKVQANGSHSQSRMIINMNFRHLRA